MSVSFDHSFMLFGAEMVGLWKKHSQCLESRKLNILPMLTLALCCAGLTVHVDSASNLLPASPSVSVKMALCKLVLFFSMFQEINTLVFLYCFGPRYPLTSGFELLWQSWAGALVRMARSDITSSRGMFMATTV